LFADELNLRRTGVKEKEEKSINILFLLDDDIRWNSPGRMGNTVVQMPDIDNLWYYV